MLIVHVSFPRIYTEEVIAIISFQGPRFPLFKITFVTQDKAHCQ